MTTFLIVGKQYSPLRNKIEAAGHKWILLKDSTINKGYSKKRENTFFCDLSSKESTVSGLEGLNETIDGVLNIYENYVLATAWVGQVLSLPAISPESAAICSDKHLMREKFATAPRKISPDFARADSWEQVEAFADTHQFPLILKPTNLSKSLLVTKNHDLDELRASYTEAQEKGSGVYAKYAAGKKPRFIIEEFLEGPIFSVDGFADARGNVSMLDVVVDYESGYDIGMEDNFHYSRVIPSRLSEEDQKDIRDVAELGMKALGMTSSPAHCELILTDEGPMMVEIGARNGGYRDRMHGLANDIDIYGVAMDLALDKPLDLERKRNDGCAVLEIFPYDSGKFVELQNEDAVRELGSYNDVRVVAKPGDPVGKSSDGFKMTARIVLFNTDLDQFQADLDFIKAKVKVITS